MFHSRVGVPLNLILTKFKLIKLFKEIQELGHFPSRRGISKNVSKNFPNFNTIVGKFILHSEEDVATT